MLTINSGKRSISSRSVVGVAQLVERWIVTPVVEGSSPFTHPIFIFEIDRNV